MDPELLGIILATAASTASVGSIAQFLLWTARRKRHAGTKGVANGAHQTVDAAAEPSPDLEPAEVNVPEVAVRSLAEAAERNGWSVTHTTRLLAAASRRGERQRARERGSVWTVSDWEALDKSV